MKRMIASLLIIAVLCCLPIATWAEGDISAVAVGHISLPCEMMTVAVGQTVSLNVTITPASASGAFLSWTSSNTSVAEASDGSIKGVKTGYSIVRARATNGVSAYIGVKVVSAGKAVTSVKISRETLTVYEGYTAKLSAAVAPKTALDRSGTWASADTSVATVSSSGVVKGLSLGTTTVTATASSGLQALCEVTVVEVPVTSVKLSKKALSVRVGGTATLTASALPAGAKDRSLEWESANEEVVTVSQEGVVTGVSPGKAYVTARSRLSPTVSARCMVTVASVKVTSVRLSPVSMSVRQGSSLPVAYQVLPTNASNPSLIWKSSKPAVASVDETGVVTAKSPGVTVITAIAADGSKTKNTCRVTVVAD